MVGCVPQVSVQVNETDNATVILTVGNKTISVDTEPEEEIIEKLLVIPLISIEKNITQDEETTINISAINNDNETFDGNLSYTISITEDALVDQIEKNLTVNILANQTKVLESIPITFTNATNHKIIVTFEENEIKTKQLEFTVQPTKVIQKTIDQAKLDRAISEGGCYDTDGGQDFDEAGTCYDNNTFQYGRADFCSGDEDVLGEVYCQQFKCSFIIEECENTCRNGECI